MVRVLQRRVPLSPKVRAQRAKKYQVYRYGVWIDPYPEVKGTKPEKMVFAELMARGIDFEFQKWWRPNFALESNEWFRPDFYLPGLNIIIEVQGAYWHSKPDQIEADAFKQALYAMSGIKCITWWDYDIETRLKDLFNAEPQLSWRNSRLNHIPQNESGIDDTLANKAINVKKRKPWTKKAVGNKIKGIRRKKNVRRYNTGA
jgi:hypothetical protein